MTVCLGRPVLSRFHSRVRQRLILGTDGQHRNIYVGKLPKRRLPPLQLVVEWVGIHIVDDPVTSVVGYVVPLRLVLQQL